jgi:hypothetical protein
MLLVKFASRPRVHHAGTLANLHIYTLQPSTENARICRVPIEPKASSSRWLRRTA